MESQPFYHLRPNKYVDRQIFAEVLKSLNRNIEIQNYAYIGMGSYMLDDFKLLHNSLGINRMISLEADSEVYRRAVFNRPFKCITVVQQTTSAFIATMDTEESNNIFWLDYTSPSEIGSQFNDFCRLISVLKEHDIIRITLNANPTALGKPTSPETDLWAYRLEELKSRLGNFVPNSVTPNNLVKKIYPLVLLACLKKAYLDTVEGKEKRFLPLYSTVYDDNTQMLTLTGIVSTSKERETELMQNQELKKYCNFAWDKPMNICMPALTSKEILHINNELPIKSEGKLIGKKYSFVFGDDLNALRSYLRFYKEYPHFHSVNL